MSPVWPYQPIPELLELFIKGIMLNPLFGRFSSKIKTWEFIDIWEGGLFCPFFPKSCISQRGGGGGLVATTSALTCTTFAPKTTHAAKLKTNKIMILFCMNLLVWVKLCCTLNFKVLAPLEVRFLVRSLLLLFWVETKVNPSFLWVDLDWIWFCWSLTKEN